jgi:hypothetical protein
MMFKLFLIVSFICTAAGKTEAWVTARGDGFRYEGETKGSNG